MLLPRAGVARQGLGQYRVPAGESKDGWLGVMKACSDVQEPLAKALVACGIGVGPPRSKQEFHGFRGEVGACVRQKLCESHDVRRGLGR